MASAVEAVGEGGGNRGRRQANEGAAGAGCAHAIGHREWMLLMHTAAHADVNKGYKGYSCDGCHYRQAKACGNGGLPGLGGESCGDDGCGDVR